ncbi:LysR family transcriptional regulator [Shewanella waksmanii]|uniref:LysR family transcriptional regulator n=1 Tax=Shewanella waksmanii TaxID=213783 RepID=UPI0037355C98
MTNNNLFEGIVIFTEVVNQGGFSAAAETLGHSTSFVSKSINKLEARLGVRLLNRTTRSIGLTPEGQAYYERCVNLVSDAEQAEQLLTPQHAAPSGRLKISSPVGFGRSHLQAIISEYLHLYPNVSLELDLNDKRIDVIADGYDLAIRASGQLEESSLICRKIYQCDALTVASKVYLQRKGMPHHPMELAHHDCISYSNLKMPNRWQYIDAKGEPFNVDVRGRILCDSGDFELSLVRDHHGICRLPGFYLDEVLKSDELTVLFDHLPKAQIEVFAIYPSRKHLSPKVRAFIDLAAARLAQ